MQGLITTLIVFAIIALALVVFVPAWLERLSRTNAAEAARIAAALQAHELDVRRLDRLIAPYGRGRSAHFTEGTAEARRRLAALHAQLDTAEETLASMRLPQVYDYLLPVKHFVLAPRDAAAIWEDGRRVRRLRRQLQAADGLAVEVQAAADDLAALPDTLDGERAAVVVRLGELDAAIRAERAAGIAALDDLERELARLRGLAARPGASDGLSALDAEATALESAAAGLETLEETLATLAADRAQLDERLRQATTLLDEAQVAKAGPDATTPQPVRPLLFRAAALLNERAPAHRKGRDFAAATADVTAATRLIELARDLTAADARIRLLAQRDDGVSLAAPIGEARRDLARLLDEVGEGPGAAPAGRGAAAPHAAREATLAARAAELRRRAEGLVGQQSAIIAGLEQDAAAIGEKLARDWEAGQRLLRLAADDPLARQQARLMDDVDAARRHPDALARLREDAATFEATLNAWVDRLAAGQERVARLRAALPGQIDTALATAAPWACLAEHAALIQQRAADFETTQGQLAATRQRRAAEALLAELEAIERDVPARLAVLSDQARHLADQEGEALYVLQLATEQTEALPEDDPLRTRREKTLGLVNHHTQTAHNALRYEDASLALARAIDLGNKLAV